MPCEPAPAVTLRDWLCVVWTVGILAVPAATTTAPATTPAATLSLTLGYSLLRRRALRRLRRPRRFGGSIPVTRLVVTVLARFTRAILALAPFAALAVPRTVAIAMTVPIPIAAWPAIAPVASFRALVPVRSAMPRSSREGRGAGRSPVRGEAGAADGFRRRSYR